MKTWKRYTPRFHNIPKEKTITENEVMLNPWGNVGVEHYREALLKLNIGKTVRFIDGTYFKRIK